MKDGKPISTSIGTEDGNLIDESTNDDDDDDENELDSAGEKATEWKWIYFI